MYNSIGSFFIDNYIQLFFSLGDENSIFVNRGEINNFLIFFFLILNVISGKFKIQ